MIDIELSDYDVINNKYQIKIWVHDNIIFIKDLCGLSEIMELKDSFERELHSMNDYIKKMAKNNTSDKL